MANVDIILPHHDYHRQSKCPYHQHHCQQQTDLDDFNDDNDDNSSLSLYSFN